MTTMFDVPHSYEAECYVIGSIMRENVLIDQCELHADDFHDERHQLIFQYMLHLREFDKPIDLVGIVQNAGADDKNRQKNLMKIGGVEYPANLMKEVPTTANFSYYCEVVKEKSTLRKTMQMMFDKMQSADSSKELIGETISELEGLQRESVKEREFVRMGDVLEGHEEVIRQRKEKRGLTGTKTVSRDLDLITGGHQKQDLIIIGARPSIGKTALVICDMIAGQTHAIKNDIEGSAAAIFSLEMDKKKISERGVCSLGDIDSRKLNSGDLDEAEWQRWMGAKARLRELPIFIDDTPGITVQEIDRKVRKLVAEYPNLTLYIDFLQLVNPGKKFTKEHEGVAYVSKQLKQIARKYNIPVVAISAVGRDCEKRQDKRPMLSDLRESGSIESDADVIIFLYRDDYYNPETKKKGTIELIIAKGRSVGTGLIEMWYLREKSRFVNIKRTPPPPEDKDDADSK